MPSLFEEVKQNNLLEITLYGVRTVLEDELGIKPILLATSNMVKAEYQRRDHASYPMAHLELGEIMGVKDQNANRNIQRHGVSVGLAAATKATTRRAFIFPATINLTLKYEHSDPKEYVAMAETLALLSMVGGISFTITLSEALDTIVRIEIPEQTSIPLTEVDEPANPGGVEIECQLIVHTYIGFFRDIAAVNSTRPITSYEITNKQYGEN